MYVFTIINFGTKIEFGTSWGKAILTLTRTDAAQQFGIHDFNQTVVENYMPIEATAKTIFLCTLLFVVYWNVGICFELSVKKSGGSIVSSNDYIWRFGNIQFL